MVGLKEAPNTPDINKTALTRQAAPASLDMRITTTGVFIAAAVILFFYLLGMRFLAYLPVPLFFISIFFMLGSISVQCLFADTSRGFSAVILAEIMLAAFLFHIISQVRGPGLWGPDAYLDLASMKAILETGAVRGVPEYIQLTSFFPIIHIIGAQTSLITGVDSFTVAKWLPSLIDLAILPLLYLLTKSMFRHERAALVAPLVFITMQNHIYFGSLFIRETIGLVLMMTCLYLYLPARPSFHPVAHRALAIVCLAAAILAHHFTSLMLMLFLIIHWLVTSLPKPSIARNWLLPETGVTRIAFSLPLLAVWGTFAYWMFEVPEPINIFLILTKNSLNPAVWGNQSYLSQTSHLALPSLRYYVLMYGSLLCYLVFGLFLIRQTLANKMRRHLETSATLFLALLAGTGAVITVLLPSTIAGDRFLTFGWLIAFGPLAVAILENRRRFLKAAGLFFVFLFMFINLYTIHPTTWNPDFPGSGGLAWRQDFALAEKRDFSDGKFIGNLNNLMPIYNAQHIEGTDAFSLFSPVDLMTFDRIIVNRRGLYDEGIFSEHTLALISGMSDLLKRGSNRYNLSYESNNVSVFEKRP
ncbi:MAG: hypothetical protein HYX96_00590 [Chloroflexi bacterium]|nr:hypothetical protein [Chloroflexota bacterium]